jgi:two-component system chemotaxis response regulator CheB
MPQMDGLECLNRLMLERPCPVVMLSSLTAEGADATLEAFRLGAVDFVAKPAGAVSLRMDEFVPELLTKVRSAAKVKLSTSLRLRERVRHRIGNVQPAARPRSRREPLHSVSPSAAISGGEGLVLVGASTGGPPALEDLLSGLTADFPWPIAVAQHIPASFTGPLAKRLDRLCAISVVEVTEPVSLRPGFAYIGHGDADIVIARKADLTAMPVPSDPDYLWHPSVDRLVRTAMDHVPPEQLIGVLMTGMGNDGAEAMSVMRKRGGRTIAESEATAVVWGMPGELVRLGGADWVIPLPSIAQRLQRLVSSDAPDPQAS